MFIKVLSPNGFDITMFGFREGNDVWVGVGGEALVCKCGFSGES